MLQKHIDKMNSFRRYMVFLNRNSGVNENYFHCSSLIKNDNLSYIGINGKNGLKTSLHAEIAAINHDNTKRKRRYTCDILVIRISGKDGKLSESRPCRNCILYMYHNNYYKIKNVIYSTREGVIKIEKLNNMMTNINTAHITTDKTPL